MSSVVRSVLGAALLLTGASAATAQSAKPPVVAQSGQTGASTATVAANNAPAAGQSGQTGASTAAVAVNNAPAAAPSQKTHNSGVSDKTDRYGGHDPNSTAGTRAFWEGLNPY
jgi:hypothetical protein